MVRANQSAQGFGWARVARVAIGLLIPALLAVMLAVPASAAPAVTMGATAGPGGGSVSASGTGFKANDFIQVLWNGRVVLANSRVDAAGKFDVAFKIPAEAAPGSYEIRYIAYTPPAQPTCSSPYVAVTFTVKPGGMTPTPLVGTAVPTVTPCVTPTATSTSTSTSTATATTTSTPNTPTVTATSTTPTSTVTTTATVTNTATVTTTATKTATTTVTTTVTKTATKTNTPVFTSTPKPTATKVNFPGTGTGFIDNDGGSSGYVASLVVSIAMLSIGVVSAGFTVARRRIR
jgi:hypothetical protein